MTFGSAEYFAPREHVGEACRLTGEEYLALRAVENEMQGRPYTTYRCKRNGRWHTVNRQYQFGVQVTFWHPIILVLSGSK